MILRDEYINGSTAIKPKRKIENPNRDKKYKELEESRKKLNKRKREKANRKIKNIRNIVLTTVVIGALGVTTIGRDGKVFKLNSELQSMKKEINTMTDENEAMKVTLLKSSSLKSIEENAKNKLKMTNGAEVLKHHLDLSKNLLEGIE